MAEDQYHQWPQQASLEDRVFGFFVRHTNLFFWAIVLPFIALLIYLGIAGSNR